MHFSIVDLVDFAMFGSDILEVAIGMVFLFLFMSMIASALREAIEAFLQQRAKLLERGLKEMLRDGTDETWVKAFYEHPMISSLYRGDYGKKPKLPSYIPKESFSLAILDVAAQSSKVGDLLSIEHLKTNIVGKNPPDAVQRVVLMALSAAGDNLAEVQKHLEDWYDATMQRVTGWYARWTGVILFVIGFGAAVALNVDSITIAKSLIVDRPLRQAIVTQAETYVRETAKKSAGAADKDVEPSDAATSVPAPDKKDVTSPPTAATVDAAQKKTFEQLRTEFAEIGFPIGWTMPAEGGFYPAPQACNRVGTIYSCTVTGLRLFGILALALMGWLITAIAVMLGAPFWFDLLNRLVSLRSALKPPDANQKKAKPTKPAPAPAGQAAPGGV